MIVRADVVEIEAVVEDADEERAGERAPDRSAAAEQTRAADDDGGDRVELVELAGARIAGVQARRDEHAGQAGGHAAHRIDRDQHAIDANARQPRRVAIAARRVDVPAERRPHQQQPREREHARHDARPSARSG